MGVETIITCDDCGKRLRAATDEIINIDVSLEFSASTTGMLEERKHDSREKHHRIWCRGCFDGRVRSLELLLNNEESFFVVRSNEEHDEDSSPLFWSNDLGWVDRTSATQFTEKEREMFTLPIGNCEWEAVS